MEQNVWLCRKQTRPYQRQKIQLEKHFMGPSMETSMSMTKQLWHLHCKNTKVPSLYHRDNTSEENKVYYVSEVSVPRF